jgi:hypothetical protein
MFISKRITLAVAGIGLSALAACGSGSNSYPTEFRDNFVAACIVGGGNKEACTCVLEAMEDTYTYERALELDQAANSGEDVTSYFQGLFEGCA